MTRTFCSVLLCALLTASVAVAKKPAHSDPANEVLLFDAIKKKQIHVLIVPRNAKRLTMTIRNLTNKPLRIQMPAALAAVPIHRQFGGVNGGANGGALNGGGLNGGGRNGGGGGGLPGGGQQGGSQGLGIGGGGGRGQRGAADPFGGGGNQANGGVFNVLPNKKVTRRLPCVCLEQGKKDPSARMKYKVVPLKVFSSDPRLVRVLSLLSRKKIRQSVAQAAAWNIANRLSWNKLAQLKHRHLNGLATPIFRVADVKAARTLLVSLNKQTTRSRRSLSDRR